MTDPQTIIQQVDSMENLKIRYGISKQHILQHILGTTHEETKKSKYQSVLSCTYHELYEVTTIIDYIIKNILWSCIMDPQVPLAPPPFLIHGYHEEA